MEDTDLTWIVLVRDVSDSVSIGGQPQLFATMVLDAGTGLVRGVSVGPTVLKASVGAMRSALTTPAGPLPPGVPVAVIHGQGHRPPVAAALKQLLRGNGTDLPRIETAGPPEEAEDLLDSFLGHLAGRAQPDDFPAPAQWRAMFTTVAAYAGAEPWLRWSDVDVLDLVVTIDGARNPFAAVILGQAGFQRGLALYPGHQPPSEPDPTGPFPVALPAGTLLLWLDPSDQVPNEFRHKAVRYGYPPDATLAPIFLAAAADGAADLDPLGVDLMTVAAAGVLAHDRRHAAPGDRGTRTTGRCPLGGPSTGSYSVGWAVT